MNRSLDGIILRYIGYAAVFLGGFALLYAVRGTLPIFLVALLLAYAFEPGLQRLEKRGYTRSAAVGLVFLVFLLLFVCLLALLASAWQQVQALSANFPKYQEQAVVVSDTIRQRLDDLRLPKDVKTSIAEAITDAQHRAPQRISGFLQSAITWMLGSVGYLGVVCIVLPIITFWLMMEMSALRNRALMLVPPLYRRDVTEVGQKINEILGRYVRGQLIICSLFGILCTVAFHILSFTYGMGYPLVLGLLAAVVYIIPYIGMASIALAAGATAYFTASAPVPCALIAVGCCVAFNLILDYGVTPRVVGQGVGLHPLMVIFALLSGAQLGGVPGMILAVPLFASLRVILIYLFPQLAAPVTILNPESEPPAKPPYKASEVLKDVGKAHASIDSPQKVEQEVAKAEG